MRASDFMVKAFPLLVVITAVALVADLVLHDPLAKGDGSKEPEAGDPAPA